MTTSTNYRYLGEISTHCACEVPDEITGDYRPAEECLGYCWEDSVEDFSNVIADFLADAPTNVFRIEGFPVWNGTVDGYFTADTATEFLAAVTVRGEWSLRFEVTPQAFTAVLSHHDVPMGGLLTVTYAPESDDQ